MRLPLPRLVTVDFSEKTKKEQGRKPEFNSPEQLIRYIARLESGAGARQGDLGSLFQYVLDHDRAMHLYASGFHTASVVAMAEQFRLDMTTAKTSSPLRHGTMSASVSAEDRPEVAEQLLEAGKTLMKLLGVDKNRYVLVIHTDTDNVHLHYLYSRIGPDGRLRERDSKFPRYQLEEATAVVAFRHGFALEAGHHSRADEHGVTDIVSNRRTRDANFDIDLDGCRARNKARAALNTGHPLEAIAIAALSQCQGSLERFRDLLAEAGIGYDRCGSGAVLVDAEGRKHKASKVNHRLSKGKVSNACHIDDIPQPSDDLLARLQARRAQLAADGVPPSIQSLEWRGFADDRLGRPDYSPADKQLADTWDADVQRCFNEERRGRPQKGPRPAYWPKKVTFEGAFGSPGWRRSPMTHFPPSYDVQDRRWQTEVWRSGELIATIRYSRMVITSKKEEDLRAALIAAHKTWGRVEVFGNRKFKRQIVALAAELNIPLLNNELQKPLQNARAKVVHDEPSPATKLAHDIGRSLGTFTAPTQAASGAATAALVEANRLDAENRSEVADATTVTAAQANLACGNKDHAKLALQASAAATPTGARADLDLSHRNKRISASQIGVASSAQRQASPPPSYVLDFVQDCAASGRPLHFPKGADGPALPLNYRQFKIEEADLLRPEVQRALRPLAIKQAHEIRKLVDQLEREKVIVTRSTDAFGRGDVRYGVPYGTSPTLLRQLDVFSAHPALQDALASVHRRQVEEGRPKVREAAQSGVTQEPPPAETSAKTALAEARAQTTLLGTGLSGRDNSLNDHRSAEDQAMANDHPASRASAEESVGPPPITDKANKEKAPVTSHWDGANAPPYWSLLPKEEIDEILQLKPKFLPYDPPATVKAVSAPAPMPQQAVEQGGKRSTMNLGTDEEASERAIKGRPTGKPPEGLGLQARHYLEQQRGTGAAR